MPEPAAPSPANAAFASFEAKWLDAYPEQAAIAAFLAPDQRLLSSAFGCLIEEIEKTAFSVAEAQVAAVKLAWWRQELLGAAAGSPRHPVSIQLFADVRARSIDASRWTALIDGAMRLLEDFSASMLADMFDHYAALYTTVARLECELLGGDPGQVGAIGSLWTITHCVRALPSLARAQERLPLPLDLLARHGLTRSMLARSGANRTAALRDYLRLLAERLRESLMQASTATLSRGVRSRLDLMLIRKASAAPDAIAWLAQHPHASRWSDLWVAWNEARRIARIASRR